MRIEKTIELRASPPTVWQALTQPEMTRQFMFGCDVVSDWRVGSSVHYESKVEGATMVHVKGEVRAIEPNRRLEVTCRDAHTENAPETVAVYTLTDVDGGTTLQVTQGDFPDEATRDLNGAHWDQALAGLQRLVEA